MDKSRGPGDQAARRGQLRILVHLRRSEGIPKAEGSPHDGHVPEPAAKAKAQSTGLCSISKASSFEIRSEVAIAVFLPDIKRPARRSEGPICDYAHLRVFKTLSPLRRNPGTFRSQRPPANGCRSSGLAASYHVRNDERLC
jgi:hypothetical protein